MPISFSLWLQVMLSLAGVQHPFYVSVCQIDHNPQNQSLEITLKVFTDDLEVTLEEKKDEKLFLGSDRETSFADSLIMEYLYKKLQIRVNQQPAQMKYLGKEVEMQVTWCYVEIKGVPDVRKLEVINTIFLETYDTQTNLVNIRVGEKKKSMLLNQRKQQDVVDF